ncbi:hypothetical protein K2X40_04710 [Candidatus Babeliales bacterium]|nr:hypothetical protein [Candidatus Babeliales bacterium]
MKTKRLLSVFITFSLGSVSVFSSVHDSNTERSSIAKFFSATPTRSVSGTQEDKTMTEITFAKTSGDGFGNFFLGTDQAGKEDSAIISTSVVKNSDGTSSIVVTPLAGLVYDATGKTVDSPFKDQVIAQMKLVGPSNNQMLAVVNDDDANPNVYVMTSPRDGLRVVSNAMPTVVPIVDTNLENIDKTPLAVEGTDALSLSDRYFFAAVKAKTAGKDPGIALFQVKDSVLAQVDPQKDTVIKAQPIALAPESDVVDGNGVNKVAGLSFYADANAANKMANATEPTKYDLHWDQQLQRLYVAVDKSKRNATNKDGGIVGILVGGFDDTNKAFVKPLVPNPRSGMFTDDQQIVGFHRSDVQADDYAVSVPRVRTMHTSTGKDYVIINGGVALDGDTDNLKTLVHALPVLPATHDYAGQLARVNGADAYTRAGLNMAETAVEALQINSGDDAATVGQEPTAIGGVDTDVAINEMTVVGDSVFVAVAGTDRSIGEERGIFQSTALFDNDGNIRNWTEWQRVAGTTDAVFGFDINSTNGNFQYLTSADGDPANDKTTIKGTAWGTSAQVTDAKSRKLTDVLEKGFPDGVYQVFNFDERTPGFVDGEFSMMVAVGADRVALIETGKIDGGAFTPTSEFIKDKNVFIFNDQALKDIAPIVTADLLRSTVADKGYVYVGGYHGVARLQDGGGNGFDSDAGLATLDAGAFPGTGFSFTELGDFENVVSIGTNGDGNDKVAVLMLESLRSFLDQDLVGASVIEQLFGTDLVVTQNLHIFATTQGLFKTENGTTITQISEVTTLPIGLFYIPDEKSKPSDIGNLYVLAVDRDDDSGVLHLFNVDGADVMLVKNTAVDLRAFRESFTTDGAFFFNQQQRDVNQSDLIRFGTRDQASASLTSVLGIDAKTNTYIGKPVRDTASGGFVVPGQFGVRVNE